MSREILPRRITAIRPVTYDVDEIRETLNGLNDNPKLEDIMEVIKSYVVDDLSCGWGHEVRLEDIIFQDENGDEI